MTATTKDDIACADPTASAIRSPTASGNRIDSRELVSNEREIVITHGEHAYRLWSTSQNKLILTQ
jgi:hemin uptake protein HemP